MSPMQTKRSAARLGALLLAPAAVASLVSCGGESGASAAEDRPERLTGTVLIDGSSTVEPLTKLAGERFGGQEPGVRVKVGASGTGGGFDRFCAGETDISDASRPINDFEKETCANWDVPYRELTIANDALTVVVPRANDWLDCITTDQLRRIWEPGSALASWQEVDPAFPDEPLQLYGPDTDSGTFDYFTEAINGEEKASRSDFTPSSDDNTLVKGVAEHSGGLGYFGFTYFDENRDKLRALEIDAGDGCVAPSTASVQDGSYKPLARPLFIYPSAKALERPEVETFVEFYVDSHTDFASEAGYIPLSEVQENKLERDLARLKKHSGRPGGAGDTGGDSGGSGGL
ncbi:PstS family phosphate ABC transporter substrate-binding protein [Streptomyces aculeolatus]